MPNFALFDHSVKIKEGIGEISIPTVEALRTTAPRSEIHLMAIHCVAAERSGLIKIEKRTFMGKTQGIPD